MDIATNLRHLREKSGLTQIEVCQRAHISQSTYSAHESGNSVLKMWARGKNTSDEGAGHFPRLVKADKKSLTS